MFIDTFLEELAKRQASSEEGGSRGPSPETTDVGATAAASPDKTLPGPDWSLENAPGKNETPLYWEYVAGDFQLLQQAPAPLESAQNCINVLASAASRFDLRTLLEAAPAQREYFPHLVGLLSEGLLDPAASFRDAALILTRELTKRRQQVLEALEETKARLSKTGQRDLGSSVRDTARGTCGSHEPSPETRNDGATAAASPDKTLPGANWSLANAPGENETPLYWECVAGGFQLLQQTPAPLESGLNCIGVLASAASRFDLRTLLEAAPEQRECFPHLVGLLGQGLLDPAPTFRDAVLILTQELVKRESTETG